MYKNQSGRLASFFGMITNIDDNIGKTRKLLKDLGVHDNTIFIFTTDNGTASGRQIFNAECEGQKGVSMMEDIRVPFFMHWPNGGMDKLKKVDTLCHAVDVAPTLLDLTGGKKPKGYKFDGVSVRKVLEAEEKIDWPGDIMLITDSQRGEDPIKWRKSSVMSQGWRLVNQKNSTISIKTPDRLRM